MNNREFIDKQIRFADAKEGKYYVYYSSAPDGGEWETQYEKPPKTDRSYTIIGAQKMYRRGEDRKIVY